MNKIELVNIKTEKKSSSEKKNKWEKKHYCKKSHQNIA